ncbi:MAG: hypothetical protein KY468_17630 [Armatimonadetes bacterium]|nr:hypothetical protein [Armatimonadota bacterium]
MPEFVKDVLNEPDPLLAFLRLEEQFRLSSPAERANIRQGWPFGRSWKIPGFDYSDLDRIKFIPLIGIDSDGLDAEARIEARLTYHAIENARSDFRDNTLDIALCYHMALNAGLDVVRLFNEAATVSDGYIANLFAGFTGDKPTYKSLWAFGFRQVILKNGVIYKWIGSAEDYLSMKPEKLDAWGQVIE